MLAGKCSDLYQSIIKCDEVHHEGRSLEKLLRRNPKGSHNEIRPQSMVPYIFPPPAQVSQAVQAALVLVARPQHQEDRVDSR